MPFVNKEILVVDFMERLRKRIELQGNSEALTFFEVFLQEGLTEAIDNWPTKVPGWDGRVVNAGDFDIIYPLAADILHNAAARNFSEHSNTYVAAHAVSTAFCEELNEVFQCSGEEKYDLISIRSFVDMAVETGTVKVENGKVSLTPEGERIAQSIKKSIKKGA